MQEIVEINIDLRIIAFGNVKHRRVQTMLCTHPVNNNNNNKHQNQRRRRDCIFSIVFMNLLTNNHHLIITVTILSHRLIHEVNCHNDFSRILNKVLLININQEHHYPTNIIVILWKLAMSIHGKVIQVNISHISSVFMSLIDVVGESYVPEEASTYCQSQNLHHHHHQKGSKRRAFSVSILSFVAIQCLSIHTSVEN